MEVIVAICGKGSATLALKGELLCMTNPNMCYQCVMKGSGKQEEIYSLLPRMKLQIRTNVAFIADAKVPQLLNHQPGTRITPTRTRQIRSERGAQRA